MNIAGFRNSCATRQTDLSEGHGDSLLAAWEGLGLRVVFQEDAAALENHIRLPVDHLRALGRFVAHRVAKLPTVGRHLAATGRKAEAHFQRSNGGKVFHPYDTVGGKSQGFTLDLRFKGGAADSPDNMLKLD